MFICSHLYSSRHEALNFFCSSSWQRCLGEICISSVRWTKNIAYLFNIQPVCLLSIVHQGTSFISILHIYTVVINILATYIIKSFLYLLSREHQGTSFISILHIYTVVINNLVTYIITMNQKSFKYFLYSRSWSYVLLSVSKQLWT
jgi:hypothetical protein